MSNTITALRLQKKNKNRVNVFLDGEYRFALSFNAAATLKKGQELTEAEIAELTAEGEQHKLYEQALRYLGYRARSEGEMRQHLLGKGHAEALIEETIDRLREEGYLDDEAFARLWLANREQLRPRGARALRYELRQKGVNDTVIEHVLADLDEEHSAWAAIQPKLRQWRSLDWPTFQKKSMGFLNRRGFGYDVCRTICERGWTEIEQDR
ncbi:RecX family transcriptional regulator [Anaerolineales bacterium HSG24]|nr:RecX family transcriptional regulator [Anaerolineales bacterium HSG24]